MPSRLLWNIGVPVVVAAMGLSLASHTVSAQGVIGRVKRAAEEAARAAAEAKKAAEERAKAQEKEKATPAVPGGGNPQANSPNAATPASAARGGGAAPSFDGPAARGSFGRIDNYKAMPDIVGIHLGMPKNEAMAVLRREYPQAQIFPAPISWPGLPSPPQEAYRADPAKVVTRSAIVNAGNAGCTGQGSPDQVQVDFTPPPNPPVVDKMRRCNWSAKAMNRDVVLSALREKYGKETVAFGFQNLIATRDSDIRQLYWLFDEAGRPAPLPSQVDGFTLQCLDREFYVADVQRLDELTGQELSPWCVSSGVGVIVELSEWDNDRNLVPYIRSHMTDLPLTLRELKNTRTWWLAELERRRKEEIEKSKQQKPKL
jgi:hypothetical protein